MFFSKQRIERSSNDLVTISKHQEGKYMYICPIMPNKFYTLGIEREGEEDSKPDVDSSFYQHFPAVTSVVVSDDVVVGNVLKINLQQNGIYKQNTRKQNIRIFCGILFNCN